MEPQQQIEHTTTCQAGERGMATRGRWIDKSLTKDPAAIHWTPTASVPNGYSPTIEQRIRKRYHDSTNYHSHSNHQVPTRLNHQYRAEITTRAHISRHSRPAGTRTDRAAAAAIKELQEDVESFRRQYHAEIERGHAELDSRVRAESENVELRNENDELRDRLATAVSDSSTQATPPTQHRTYAEAATKSGGCCRRIEGLESQHRHSSPTWQMKPIPRGLRMASTTAYRWGMSFSTGKCVWTSDL
ncbi:hypothetical protein BGX38DRAFT_1300337 [Terfezia claveryi]|nr:hypothetical protein BGX38DRAFT_1300337 [Terfezia claveryi]